VDTHNNVELVKHIHALLSEQQQTACCLHGKVLNAVLAGFTRLRQSPPPGRLKLNPPLPPTCLKNKRFYTQTLSFVLSQKQGHQFCHQGALLVVTDIGLNFS
jgi:hypothetical protein